MLLGKTQPDTLDSLTKLARQVSETCPDMRQMAREVAQQILDRHGLQAHDPDSVYLHRFHTAVSSPRTFNGWQHLDPPYESLTLPQLVMHRFDANDQDNADLLGYLVGFYSDGPGKDAYDELNEVRLDARNVLEYFWSIDFASHFKSRLKSFWSTHSENFRTLAKANFLSKVLEACAQDPTSGLAKCCREVTQALVGDISWPPSIAALQHQSATGKGIRACTFDIGGHVATDILRVQMQDGRQLVYLPGDVDALQVFENDQALFWWVLNHCNQAENRARFMAHFSLQDRDEGNTSIGLNHLVDLLYQGWGKDDYSGLNTLDQRIDGDVFSWLRDKAHQRMLDDAHVSLRSNDDLRKQLWIGYLRASLRVFGPMAAVDWPVALALVGAGMAETGLNIDQAISGHTTCERKAGVTGAILSAIETLFNATFLLSAPGQPIAELAEVTEAGTGKNLGSAEDPATAGEVVQGEEEDASVTDAVKAWVPAPFQPAEGWPLLSPFETNVLLSGEPGTGALQGIYTQDGQFYVLIDELPYQVRFAPELKTWAIVPPETPFSFYKSQPIRLDDEGHWYPVDRGGLKGGMLPRLKIWGRRATGTSQPALAATPYEVPADLRASLKDVADEELTGVRINIHDPDRLAAVARFLTLREQLATDARDFMATVQAPARPRLPDISPGTTPKQILQNIYENSQGLVVGEAHSSLGSKRFLIDNMAVLRKLKVKTLYMEHFTTDFQQADLDAFNRSGQLPTALDRYITAQDFGHQTDLAGRYTFRRVLLEAQKNGLRIQSIDCMASYRQAWATPPSPVARQEMMNFYAHLIIEADQAARGPGKWVALVGNTHANNFHGVTGLAETEGVVGLRVEDTPVGGVDSYAVDPGVDAPEKGGKVWHLKSDIRLRASIEPFTTAATDFETLLIRPGDYTFEHIDSDTYLINRSRDLSLRRTPVKRDGRFYYIERPDWPTIHERRLEHLSDLDIFLRMRGMRHVAH